MTILSQPNESNPAQHVINENANNKKYPRNLVSLSDERIEFIENKTPVKNIIKAVEIAKIKLNGVLTKISGLILYPIKSGLEINKIKTIISYKMHIKDIKVVISFLYFKSMEYK